MRHTTTAILLGVIGMLLPAVKPVAAQTAAVLNVINIDTTKTIPVPSRRNFSGANMQIFYTGTSYLDPKMQQMVQPLHLGWVRFPAGTVDDVYDWKTGDLRDEWIAQFKGTKTEAYGNFIKDVEINRGKGLNKIDDFASFLATQHTGDGPDSPPTHTIGVINTFTDTPESAAELVLAAKKKNLMVDMWELGNEPVYFEKFYPSATAYLDSVKPFAMAIKKADPTARVAVYVDRKDEWLNGMAAYKDRYWDELYLHAYPTPPKLGSDADKLEFYNGFLLNITNRFVDGTLAPLFGNGMEMEISEFNIGALRGGMFAAVFIAEYTLRLSSDPHITQMGMHTLIGRESELDAGILPTNDHKDEAIAAARAGKTVDTTHEDFGYYYTPDGLALQIINGVINTSDGLWPTTVLSGDTVPSPSTGPMATAGKMPALYAQAYKSAGNTTHLLLTNKSATAQALSIQLNGKPMKALFSTVSIGATDPMARNTADAPEAVRLHRDTVSGTVMVPPYGVMDVSWRKQ